MHRNQVQPPVSLDHLGYGRRLAGPVDNPEASCMGYHHPAAGFPPVSIALESSTLAAISGVDDTKTSADHQNFRMNFYNNATSGTTFSDSQL